ncbi:MAG TPA: hypothetical protein VJR71_01125 [Pseudolabrys sp.]|nr:hypothetical protein [Pseudolabrys sp.]
MSKYERLGQFLKKQDKEFVPMTFAEVERVTGVKLPPSALKHRPWWSNNPDNSVMTKVWLDAGFESEQVDMEKRKLVFKRVRKAKATGGDDEKPFHPAWGAMKGLIRIMPGVDITQPADPEWADRLDAEYGPEKREK